MSAAILGVGARRKRNPSLSPSAAVVLVSIAFSRGPLAADESAIERYEQYALTHTGDSERGRAIFRDEKRTRCIACHRTGEEGGELGPDLSRIGGKFDRPHLIESLLEPSRQIVEGYRATTVVTNEGEAITGVLRDDSNENLTLVDAELKTHVIPSPRIRTREMSEISLMPAGITETLSSAELTDLVAYLETLRPGGKEKFGGGVVGPVRLPDGFRIRTVATGLTGATALETTRDGRVFVCEQTGALRVVKHGRLLDEPFVTLPVEANWERGLIGVTVAPDFPAAPYVYVCYVAGEPFTHHRVSRFTAKGDVAAPGSEEIILVGDDQKKLGGNVPAGHQGGALHFGNDGCLYVGIGEQTAGAPAQKLGSLLGKILRIHPDGAIPEDNPFTSATTGKYRAIWARGCRNPFTFSFRDRDGLLLINDVGGRFEEINRGVAGANYGWPVVDHGPVGDERFQGPEHIYKQASISGGDFLRAESSWPKEFRDRYFFADFVHGWVKTVDPNEPQVASTFASGLRRPVDLRFSSEDVLYVLLRNAWVIDRKFEPGTGSLLAIERSATESSPSAEVDAGSRIRFTENAVDASAGNLACYRIETRSATYYLEKTGAGLSSLLDRDGNDWLGFRPDPGSGASGEYRGFPNAVHKQGGSYFHPRNRATDPSTTRVEYVGPERVTISATADRGHWAGRFDFYADRCTFTMTKMPAEKKYWVLYEGTPGGEYDDEDWWLASGSENRHALTERRRGDLPSPEWIAFGDRALERTLVLVHHEDDEHPDTFYAMQKKMTVFGFGREGIEKFIDRVPQSFSIAFSESPEPAAIDRVAAALLEPSRAEIRIEESDRVDTE